jgi:hypothetical protein
LRRVRTTEVRRNMDEQLRERTMRHGASSLWTVLFVAFAALLAFVLLAPTCHRPDHPAIFVKQKAQLHSMDAAIELFRNESNAYPPSDANDVTGKSYCGAMKLAEALMGRDLRGFHPQSVFRRDGMGPNTLASLYPASPAPDNLKARMRPYLASESANAWRLADIYGKGKMGPFPEDTYVLCDVFERMRPSGVKTGMPILYYRANRLGTAHRPSDPNNIYDSTDNHALLALGVPGDPNKTHPLIDPNRFYLNTQDPSIKSSSQPYRADSYILISAGWDGLYGTADDICNFSWRYREQ